MRTWPVQIRSQVLVSKWVCSHSMPITLPAQS